MQQLFSYTVSGLTTAAIYAIAATGLVLTYTITGVFNFAHGAMSMLAAFTYWEMRFAWHWPAPVALAVCIFVLAPLFGAGLERVIMRRLDGTSETTRLVVTVSLMLGLLGLSIWIWDPTRSRPIRKFWDGRVVTVFGVRIPYHFVAALAIAGLVAALLRVVLTRTRIGVAMRACVDDRSLAALNGARQSLVSMASWAVGSMLAAAAGILISPTLNLSALPLTLLVVNAYAAAMIGRLRNLPMTFLGALILGLANDYFRGYADKIPIEAKYLSGFLASIPIIILFVVLLVLPQSRLRGHASVRTRETIRLPTWAGSAGFAIAVVVGAAFVSFVVPRADMFSLDRMWGLGIVALSIIPVVGYAGQISLCQLSFAGIGMVVMQHVGQGGSPLALVWAAVVPALVGLLVALPSFRLSGIYLALSTAAFAVLMDRWIFLYPRFRLFGRNWDIFNGGSLNIARTRFFGVHMTDNHAFYIFGAGAFALVALVVVAIRRSTYGQRLIALKDSPAACATLCMNPKAAKLGVFALSAAMAGLGGAIYGQALQAATPDSVQLLNSLSLLMVMVIAGLTSPGAALFAGLFLGFGLNSVVFGKLAALMPHGFGLFETFFSKLGANTLVLVGLAGIGLGQDPDGFIASQIRPRWDAFVKRPRAIAAVVGALALAYVLERAEVLANWPYALVSLVILALAPVVLGAASRPDGPVRLSGALEWLGQSRPLSATDLEEIDRVLALPSAEEVAADAGAGSR